MGGYKDGKAILADAFWRMVAAIQLDHAINGSYDGLPVLAGVNVSVRSPNDELKFRVDESYRLTVPSTGSPLYARIELYDISEKSPEVHLNTKMSIDAILSCMY
ncbi:hypothetical protein ZWY2020_059808 [Hordeum vulgare]|nr:hypothetical protein ZWY2020_059808 [Hordeum vulgare]